ncbi:MAG TPA: class I SAM-dependent methyltransferase [Bryobacteraceae bacterium]|nr:class I SAM-dependent methyltransferase [Bryobacteraceae bacterium]
MAAEPELKTEELTALLREVRHRVRSQYASASAAGIALPDLMPVLHARDAALAKVAAIGSVNPRPPGVLNGIIQALKRAVSRALDWHVRDQVEFNRGMVTAFEAVMEALNENNRTLAELASRAATAQSAATVANEAAGAAREAAAAAGRASDDAVAHWVQWRAAWERNLDRIEKEFLRSVAELQAAFQYEVKLHHSNYGLSLEKAIHELQASFWEDMARSRDEMGRLIQGELRLIRQRLATGMPSAAIQPATAIPSTGLPAVTYDAAAHAERFRGSEEYVREKQRRYVPLFQDATDVLDIGCGRGEFLELMREAGVKARGIDLSAEAIALCRERGFDAEVADLFPYLAALPDESLGGVFSAQVVEHIEPARLPEMIHLIAAKLERGGRVAIETPNPECLAIFAVHFYLDPTHQRPVPSELLRFWMEEAGLSEIRVESLSPAVETMPSLAELPEAFRAAFFGGLDYVITAKR